MKKILANFNWRVFIITAVVISILFLGVLVYTLVRKENADETVPSILVMLLHAIVFPFGYLIDSVFPHTSDALFITALFLDIFFYAFIIERIYTFFKRRKKIEA